MIWSWKIYFLHDFVKICLNCFFLSSQTWCILSSDLHLQKWLQCGETCDKLVCLLQREGLNLIVSRLHHVWKSGRVVACRAVGGSWCGDWIVCRGMSKMKTTWQLERLMCKENKVYVLLEKNCLILIVFYSPVTLKDFSCFSLCVGSL